MKALPAFFKKLRMTVANNKNRFIPNVLKSVTYAAIVIPCALNASAVTLAEQGNGCSNSGAVLGVAVNKCVPGCGAVLDGGDLVGKSLPVRGGDGAQDGAAFTPEREEMKNNDANKAANDGDSSGDYWDWYLYGALPLQMWLLILLQSNV